MTEKKPAGAELARHVADRGIRTIFSLAGAGHTHFLLPLEDLGVRIVGTRHETGAVGAADGYARATGAVGVAAIIAEQGLPNAIAPLSTAFHHGTPLVVLVTRFPDSWVEAAGEYPVDHHGLVAPVSKWVRTVPSADKLIEYFETACRFAQSGRPGPAVLVIPQDFLATPITAHESPSTTPPLPSARVAPETVEAAAAMIAKAERPAILIDSGVLDGDANGEVVSSALEVLNSTFGIPVFTYGSARGLLPEDKTRVLPWPYAQIALSELDLLLVAGARLNMWFGFGRAPRFPTDLKVIQFDTVAEDIGRNTPVALGGVGDPAQALRDLSLVLTREHAARGPKDINSSKLHARRDAVKNLAAREDAARHPLELLEALETYRPHDGVFVADGADILNWSQAVIRIKRVRGYMDHHPLGSMGVSLPMALGAAAAERDIAQAEGRPPIRTTLLTGDGSLGFYIGELDTIHREDLPLTIIVGNDGQWGTEIHGQRLMTGRDVNTSLGVGDYGQIATGFGWRGFTVDADDDLNDIMKRAFDGDGPALVDVRIDPEAGAALKTDPNLSFLIFSDLAPPSL